jgi:hypothetical protein
MQKYKVTASKSQKKYTFVVSEENENLVRKRIHDGGYSILSVELFDESSVDNNVFIFEAEKKSKIKSGKVLWNDIFKIYLKLKDHLWYNVLKLYSVWDREKTDKEKLSILKGLEEQYTYFNSLSKKNNKKEKENTEKNYVNIDDFYLKKELEEIYKLIDFVLDKLSKLLVNEKYKLEDTKKEKLKNLYNSLIKIKSSTNIYKLKEVWEAVLLKIWEIELEYLEKSKDEVWKTLLTETNNLLKKIWSEKKFIQEDKDIKKQIENIFIGLKSFFNTIKSRDKQKEVDSRVTFNSSDKTSHEYLKTIIFLNKYKQKLKQNNLDIYKNLFVFMYPSKKNNIKKQGLVVRRKVIKQNIFLFKAKIQGKVFSYTKIIKGFDYILENIFQFFNQIKDYLFFVVFFYSLLFLLFLNLNYYSIITIFERSLNYNGVFYFIIFLFIYFAIYLSRGIYSLLLNISILLFIIFFSIINF